MSFYAILCPVHLFCLGIAVAFDTVCLVNDAASIVNCTEKVLLRKPQSLLIVCHLSTIFNSTVVLTALYIKPAGITFCGFRSALRNISRKGKFWSFNIMFCFVILDYIIMISRDLNVMNNILAVTLVLFFASPLLVAYFLNYTQPVRYPDPEERNFTTVYTFVAYWLTLIMFFLDTAHATVAFTLDFADKVSLTGDVRPGSRDFSVVAQLVLLGIRATFAAQLLTFYWNKIFHGDRDLFSAANILKPIEEQQIYDREYQRI